MVQLEAWTFINPEACGSNPSPNHCLTKDEEQTSNDTSKIMEK